MAFERKDRVKDTTTTTGTGTVTLTGTAPAGFRSVSAAHTDGSTVRYTISMGSEWEVGEGVYTASGNTLSRATVLASSNAGALVNFSAGTKDIITTLTANEVDELVKGPASATANSLARFDGTTGKLLKDGAVIGTDVQAFYASASQAEMEAGTETALRAVSPLRIAQAIAALGSSTTLDSPITMATGSPAIIEISTSIPAGTKRIDIGVAGGSTNSTSNWLVQIGDSGGFETTGYVSGATNDNGTRATSTAGFIVTSVENAAYNRSGIVTLLLIDAATNTWAESGQLTETGSGLDSNSAGSKALSGELTSVRLTTVGGSATFDAGTLAIQYS